MNILKKYAKKLQITPSKLKEKKAFGKYGNALFHHTLWHPTRRSIQRSFFIGLFWSTPPIPLQMPIVAGFCLKFQANLPVALSLVWVTNPITIVPITLLEYWLGSQLLDIIQMVDMTGMSEQMESRLNGAMALLLGVLTLGVCAGGTGYIVSGVVWRWRTIQKWQRRIKRNATNAAS